MATTVNAAFHQFLTNSVNLDPEVTRNARSSREWLLSQIHVLHTKHDDFPFPYTEKDIHYGSFARRTKIRELDDIDLIACMKAEGATYFDSGGLITITVPSGTRLQGLCYDGTDQLNSRKVVNRFVKHLSDIPQYKKAYLGRNGSAAILDLASYTWSFDIVPGFFTAPESEGRTYSGARLSRSPLPSQFEPKEEIWAVEERASNDFVSTQMSTAILHYSRWEWILEED